MSRGFQPKFFKKGDILTVEGKKFEVLTDYQTMEGQKTIKIRLIDNQSPNEYVGEVNRRQKNE